MGSVEHGLDLVQRVESRPVGCKLVRATSPDPRPDHRGGAAVAGARMFSAWGDPLLLGTSTATGWIETSSKNDWFVQIVDDRHGRVVVRRDRLKAAADPEPLRVELTQGLALRARLLRHDGTAVVRARVWLHSSAAAGDFVPWFDCPWPERTDGEGRLQVGCLHSQRNVTGCVEVDGVWQVFLCRVISQDSYLGDITVTGIGRVEGRVLGPDGAPVAGAQVLLLHPRADHDGADLATWPVRSLLADRMGRFAVSGLVAGTWRIAARSSSLGAASATFDSTRLEEVVLRLPPGLVLAGRVVDVGGRGAAHASVRATVDPRPSRPASPMARFGLVDFACEADGNGNFILRGLPDEGALYVRASLKRDQALHSAELRGVRPGRTNLELVVERR
jgi:hypothetical protein